jgi:PLP dependent protein
MASISANLSRIRDQIQQASLRVNRRPEEVTLVGISKTHTPERIRDAYEAGIRHFGENRVQEWESKRVALVDLDATWHMVGHVQSNKAARVVRLFQAVDSLDSITLAERLDRAAKELEVESTADGKLNRNTRESRLRVLIEVKLDGGGAKTGVNQADLPQLVIAALKLPNLELAGLMGVPPYFDDPQKARPYFQRLRAMRDAIRSQMGADLLPALSMGMSHDFEVAIEEGATEIRIGTALFGERPKA